MTDETEKLPVPQAAPCEPQQADDADRRKAMERMLGLLAAAPAAALLFDPRHAQAFGDGSLE